MRLAPLALLLLALAGCAPRQDAGPALPTFSHAPTTAPTTVPASSTPWPVVAPLTRVTPRPTTSHPAVVRRPVLAAVPRPARVVPTCDEATRYVNSTGACVPRPVAAAVAPAGVTAKCGDGTYSFSQHRSGTCSKHGGVARWL